MYTFQVMCLDLNQNCALSGATTRSQVYASAAACLDAMDLRELRNEYGRMRILEGSEPEKSAYFGNAHCDIVYHSAWCRGDNVSWSLNF